MLAKRIVASVPIGGSPPVPGDRPESRRDRHTAVPSFADGADELMIVAMGDGDPHAVVEKAGELAGQVFVPLTACCGTASLEAFEALVRAGADRVYVPADSAAELVRRASLKWGRPAVALRVDVREGDERGTWRMFASDRTDATPIDLSALVAATALGVGEILIRAPRGDLGDFVKALRAVADSVDVPVLVSGAVRTPEALRRVLIEGGVDGLVFGPGAIEEFETVVQLKKYLAAAGIVVRGA